MKENAFSNIYVCSIYKDAQEKEISDFGRQPLKTQAEGKLAKDFKKTNTF